MAGLHIGHTAGSAAGILRTHGLAPLRQILSPGVFAQAFPVRPAPKRILVPEVVFWLMATVALGAGSMAGCICGFWASLRAALPWLPAQPVTEEAFCTARRKLPLRFFLALFMGLISRLPVQPHLRWKGLRPLGIDGSDVDLPRHPHLRQVFPPASNQHGASGPPQARLVGLVGLWDGICYDFCWTSLTVGEQASARRLLRHLGPGDLLMCDRNFPDQQTLAAVRAQAADFLFHLPSNRFLKLARTKTPSGRPDEWYSHLNLPPELRRQFPHLGPQLKVRILQYQRKGFRTSWLITSLLDTERYPYCELVELYHERWRQETFHREWKHTLELTNLRSLTATGLLKEVLVQLTLNNAIRWIMAQAAPPPLRPVELQFLQAKRLILAAVPAMTVAPAYQLPRLYQQLLDTVGHQRILVRPGRSYPRRWDARGRPKGHGKVAAPAKLALVKEQSHASI